MSYELGCAGYVSALKLKKKLKRAVWKVRGLPLLLHLRFREVGGAL